MAIGVTSLSILRVVSFRHASWAQPCVVEHRVHARAAAELQQ